MPFAISRPIPLWRCCALCVVAAALAAAGCAEDGPQDIDIEFVPLVGGRPFSCTSEYGGLGTGQGTARPLDFRLYLHDLALVTRGGQQVPVTLKDDDVWQRYGVALLDFEDATGTCNTGSVETNAHVVGRTPTHGDYVGVTFRVGVPASMNHLDAATAPAPFNAPGLWWSWQGGYKYARIDVSTRGNPNGFYFHLGATTCDGTVAGGFGCRYDNVSTVSMVGFQPGRNQVALDIAPLYDGVDIDRAPDYQADSVAGCMAFSGDPECPAMFAPLGLSFEDGAVAPARAALFTVIGGRS